MQRKLLFRKWAGKQYQLTRYIASISSRKLTTVVSAPGWSVVAWAGAGLGLRPVACQRVRTTV